MDQDVLVNEQIDSGKHLIEALVTDGFEVRVAFWAKPTDEGKWFLYLASPVVDAKGPAVAYRQVHKIVRKVPDLWLDPLEIRVIGLNDSLAESALKLTKPNVPDSPFAVRNPPQCNTRVGESTFGGVDIDGAYIYAPSQPSLSV